MQIEATSPTFRTANGISTVNTVGQLTSGAYNWLYLTYGYDHPESGWQNYYFVKVNKGISLEFEGWQEDLFRRSQPSTILVHRAGTRPCADVGGSLVTDTLDSIVLMADE